MSYLTIMEWKFHQRQINLWGSVTLINYTVYPKAKYQSEN